MKKHEAKFHTKLMLWLKYNLDSFPKSFLIETKVVRPGRKTFSLSEISEKEILLLLRVKHKSLLQTHSDISRLGTNCDGACISGGGYIFLQWVRTGNKIFYVIDIDDIMKLEGNLLTEVEARNMAFIVGELK